MELIVISPTRLKIMLTEPDMRRSPCPPIRRAVPTAKHGDPCGVCLTMPVRRPAFETEGARLLIQLYASRTGGCEIFVTKLGDRMPRPKR